jgi:hypothetical protein
MRRSRLFLVAAVAVGAAALMKRDKVAGLIGARSSAPEGTPTHSLPPRPPAPPVAAQDLSQAAAAVQAAVERPAAADESATASTATGEWPSPDNPAATSPEQAPADEPQTAEFLPVPDEGEPGEPAEREG